MNLQTTKPRARWLAGGDPTKARMWEVRHPGTSAAYWTEFPHDAAITLLRRHVLPRMVEGGRK